MWDSIQAFDQQIVLWANGLHNPVMDEIMWVISSKIAWIPLYIFLFWVSYKTYGFPKVIYFTVFILLTIGLTDFICSGILKPYFERFRPSHEPALEGMLHFYQYGNGDYYKGGMYGFVSSHAGNFFALGSFCGFGNQKTYPRLPLVLLGIAVVVSFSRMYLAAHYLTDIIAGGLIGVTVGVFMLRLFNRIILKK